MEIWLRHFYRTWSYNPEMMSDQEVAFYVKAYSQPGALRGAFNGYYEPFVCSFLFRVASEEGFHHRAHTDFCDARAGGLGGHKQRRCRHILGL